MAYTSVAIDPAGRNAHPSPSALKHISAKEICWRWEAKISTYYRAVRLMLGEEPPLVAAICQTILLHEQTVVPTASIQDVLEKRALPYQLLNRHGRELTEREIVERWQERCRN